MEEQLSRRERKKIQARNTILEAGAKLFDSCGFQSTSIADIMNEADMGVGTFYNYFSSKEDVLKAMLNQMSSTLQQEQAEMQEVGVPISKALPRLIMLTARLIDERRFVIPLFISAGSSKDESGNRGSNAPHFMMLFLNLVKEGQKDGCFRNDIAPELITEMFHSLFQAAAFSRIPISFEENISSKLRIIMDGIRLK